MLAMFNNHNEADRTIFVGNLDSSVKEEILFELFLQAGPLTRVTIAKDKDGKQKSYGFVCYKHREAVPYAIALLNGIRLYGRPIKLQYRFGSSHTPDAGCSYPGSDNSPCRTPQGSCRNDGYPEVSLFPTPPFTANTCLSQEYFYWQHMASGYAAQQCSFDAHMAQQQYYLTNAMTQQATMVPTPVFQSTVQDIRAGPSYCIWENLQHNGNEMEQNEGQLENDSDRSRERRHKKSRVSKHAYRKHKTKQKSS
ncbi:splicing regulator RBM11-like isoform X1 [Acipenser ruthenus]|uniref:splicing regulator RBM11-like isoform X1 n=1 Tax=Acipenser ruthenus TaxID=7906 RepID=UPI00145ABE87|nr:splicing regulator RBM11-like isoform X1 [Acipenser ruthenus]